MSTHDDLLAVRDAVLSGADWLDAMLDVAGPERSKRFVMMRIALVQSIPTRGTSYLLSDFFTKANAEQVANFFYATAQRLPSIEACPAVVAGARSSEGDRCLMAHQINLDVARDKLGGAELAGVLATDLRIVTMDFCEGGPTSHIILAEHLETFVEACKRLHFNPGVNPVNGSETARIWRIRVSDLKAAGPYWWSTPNLGDNGQPEGALIINEGTFSTVWIDENHEVLT